MLRSFRGGVKQIAFYIIPVNVLDNDEDWQFTFVDAGNGKKQMAVF